LQIWAAISASTICTVLNAAYERQIEEMMDALSEEPKSGLLEAMAFLVLALVLFLDVIRLRVREIGVREIGVREIGVREIGGTRLVPMLSLGPPTS
jgi:hypothetical protein